MSEIRFPLLHQFLKWLPTAAAAGGVAIAAVWTEARDWLAQQALQGWYHMTDPWIALLLAGIFAIYIWALIYTGSKPGPKTIRAQPVPKSWVEHAQNLPPPPAPGTLLHEMEMQTAVSKFPELQREQVNGRAAVNLKLHPDYLAEQARQKAIDEAEARRRSRRAQEALGLSLTSNLERYAKDREAEQEADRQRLIREAREGDDKAKTFVQAWDDIESDRVPFVRIRHIAHEFELVLDPHDPTSGNMAYDIEGALRQAAVDGQLKVWGRKYRGPVKDNDPLVAIPQSHFEDYGFAHGNLHYETANSQTHTTSGIAKKLADHKSGEVFYDVQISYADTRRVLTNIVKDRSDEKG